MKPQTNVDRVLMTVASARLQARNIGELTQAFCAGQDRDPECVAYWEEAGMTRTELSAALEEAVRLGLLRTQTAFYCITNEGRGYIEKKRFSFRPEESGE